ncbi:MAG TPA: TonB-dependent receptor [Longimicrobiales bacterium]|nr:TonB-dependent receptor [Longimicrobiales bacterium]
MSRRLARGAVSAFVIAVLAAVVSSPAGAQQDTLAQEVDSLARRLSALELQLAEQQVLMQQALEDRLRAEERAAVAGRDPARIDVPDQRQRMVSGIYGRPFVWRGGGAAVGGYVDIELEAELDDEGELGFDQHRLIPFVFAEITDRIHFGTEIELEHGVSGNAGNVKVEFAALDVAFADALAVRGGIVLSPLGKFNLIHDSPVNDFTQRPLVNGQIIPTTLSEAGLGLFGTFYPSELSVLTYEAYVVNGFHDGLAESTGELRRSPRIRSGRGNLGGDNNRAKSLVARLGYSPFLGLELGVSGHTGVYSNEGEPLFYTDDAGVPGSVRFDGDERLTIGALDGIFTRGPFEVLGEAAYAMVDMPEPEVAAPPTFDVPEQVDQLGYYVQSNYHFGHGWVGLFDRSVFTASVRWGAIDFDTDVDGDDATRLSFGLNWRPVEETVFKLSYDIDSETPRLGEESEDEKRIWFSLASYF